MKTIPRSFWVFGLVWVSLVLPESRAMFASPQDVPLERLLAAARAAVVQDPTSTEARYTLARIHYLAFSLGRVTVPAFPVRAGEPVAVAPSWKLGGANSGRYHRARQLALQELRLAEVPTDGAEQRAFDAAVRRHLQELELQDGQAAILVTERTAHAAAALKEFEQVLRIEPNNSLYVLGLASLIEEIVGWKQTEEPKNLPAALEGLDLTRARETYLRAHRLAFQDDGKLSRQPVAGTRSLVSWEAGKGYLRLTEDGKSQADPAVLRARDEVIAGVEQLERLPMGMVTPMIFSLRAEARIEELLAPESTVAFDLRGYGVRTRWSWVKPDAGILVWDPLARGAIESGRQLFGGYTFEIFRATGYDALAALDDDADGWLKGEELAGVRAWFDTNVDGRSEPAEMRDLTALGIASVAVRPEGADGPHLVNRRGLLRADGTTLPTWDWMAEPRGN